MTTTRVTHATPAGLYANAADRNWECDGKITETMSKKCPNFRDIATQLIVEEPGKSLNVISIEFCNVYSL